MKTKKVQSNVRMDEGLLERIDKLSQQDQRSRNSTVIILLEYAVTEAEKVGLAALRRS